MLYCEPCFEKQKKIDKLEDENKMLKQKVRTLENRNKEGYFGKNTPSAQKPFKENSIGEKIPTTPQISDG